MISWANWTRKWVSCSKDKQSRAAGRKTAEYIISAPPRSAGQPGWTAPKPRGQKEKEKKQNMSSERASEDSNSRAEAALVCVCEREEEMFHTALEVNES